VAKKRSVGRYPKAFRKMALERLKGCDNIVALSEELGVHRRLLYKWRDQLEPIEDGKGPPAVSEERELRQQVSRLKRLVADKTLEADFFKGALQKIETRRQSIIDSVIGKELPAASHGFHDAIVRILLVF
jgi:transposase-like protein